MAVYELKEKTLTKLLDSFYWFFWVLHKSSLTGIYFKTFLQQSHIILLEAKQVYHGLRLMQIVPNISRMVSASVWLKNLNVANLYFLPFFHQHIVWENKNNIRQQKKLQDSEIDVISMIQKRLSCFYYKETRHLTKKLSRVSGTYELKSSG